MRFGLFGTGPWARMTQGPALAAHPDVELVGVWGRRPEAAAEVAAELGTRAVTDADRLMAECDAVAMALPPDVQAPLAARAARTGCHLLLDKPVATTPDGAREVAAAVETAGVASVVFFTMRFATEPAAWVAEQQARGGWSSGTAQWLSSVFGDEHSTSPYAASPWRRERGGLWDLGPHVLSVLLPILGDVADLREIRALGNAADTAHLLLPHTSGAVSSVTLGHTVPPPAAGTAVEVRGEAGAFLMPTADEWSPTTFARAVDALRTAAAGGAPHPCDVRFAARVTEILAAAEAALPRGVAV